MRKSFLAAAVLGATVLSANALGQLTRTPIDATPYNISIKGGVFFPIDSNLRDVDNLFGGVGIEYLFPTQLISGSETFMELDWLFHTTAGDNLNGFPLTINQRFNMKGGLFGKGASYFYVGAGVTWFDPHGAAKFTGHVGVGTDIGPKVFVDAGLFFSEEDKNLGLRNTGLLMALGYRF